MRDRRIRLVGHKQGWRGGRVEQLAAERQLVVAVSVRKEAVVPNAMEAVRQGVQQKAADELPGSEGHDLRLAMVAIILPAEGDLGVAQTDQSGVGDGEPKQSAADCLLRIGKGRSAIDYACGEQVMRANTKWEPILTRHRFCGVCSRCCTRPVPFMGPTASSWARSRPSRSTP